VESGLTYAIYTASILTAGMILGVVYFSELRSKFN
jgi:hypothetical protein